MKNNYIYVPGLSESVADEVKKEKDAEAPRFITGTGAVKNIALTTLSDYRIANRDSPFVLKGGARLLVKRKMFEMFLDESNII